jgi:hypothetical protein
VVSSDRISSGRAVCGIGLWRDWRRIHLIETISGKEENVECRMTNFE